MSVVTSILPRLKFGQAIFEFGCRYGRSYWRLPRILRGRICRMEAIPRIKGSHTFNFGGKEKAPPLSRPAAGDWPTFGHWLSGRRSWFPPSVVSRLDRAWLVGEFATPVTAEGRLLLSPFREEARMLGLEKRPNLEAWLEERGWTRSSDLPVLEHVCSLVNRLQSNYFHWMIEWATRLELVDAYRERTGTSPTLIVPSVGPACIRESLTMLGYGDAQCIPWPVDSPPREVRGLVLPSFRGISPRGMRWLRDRLLVASGADNVTPFRKIYIPRPKGWRYVINDDEVAQSLIEEGFEILQPQQLSLAQQIRLFSEATMIVGMLGAGLTNLLFAPGASVVELVGIYGDGTFYEMASRMGQPFRTLVCEPDGENIRVPIEQLKRTIAELQQHPNETPAYL